MNINAGFSIRMYNSVYMRSPSKNRLTHLLVAISYVLLAILATWPLTTHLATHFPTSSLLDGGDPNVFIWYIDWIAKSISGATATDPGLMIFYPAGIDMFSGYDGPLMLAVGLPVVWLSGNPVLAYNIFILSAFLFTALSTYALLRYLTGSLYASVIGGFIFGFSPYMMVRATGHPNLLMLGVVPLLALATIRFCRAPTMRGAAWFGGAILLSTLSSWYYALGGAIFIAIVFLIHHKTLLKYRETTAYAIMAALLAFIIPALPIILSGSGAGRLTIIQLLKNFGLHPMNLIIPHPFMNIFTAPAKLIYFDILRNGNGSNIIEMSNYLGLPVIALMIMSFFHKRLIRPLETALWAISFIIFIILALGTSITIYGTELPLPFALLNNVFPYSLFRVPNRFFVYVLLAATVMAAYALSYIEKRLRGKGMWLALFTVPFAALLVSERMIIPFPLLEHRVPAFYEDIAGDTETYAVADLPHIHPGISIYNYYQTVHEKPLVTGEFFYPAYSDRVFSFIRTTPLLYNSICRKDGPREATPDDVADSIARLHAENVRYAVIHNLILHNIAECEATTAYLRDFFRGVRPYFTDGEITVYRIPDGI